MHDSDDSEHAKQLLKRTALAEGIAQLDVANLVMLVHPTIVSAQLRRPSVTVNDQKVMRPSCPCFFLLTKINIVICANE